MKLIDLTGVRFSRLLVINRSDNLNTKEVSWDCKCDCGNTVSVRGYDLRRLRTKSCGCLQRDEAAEKHTKHGLSTHPLYSVYYNAKDRCTNPSRPNYKHYGGRGIKFLFSSLEDFIDKMFPSFKEGLSLDRIDNNGHYEYGNCHWVLQEAQINNRRSTIYLTMEDGTNLPLALAAKKYDMKAATLRARYHKHGDNFKELFKPIKGRVKKVS